VFLSGTLGASVFALGWVEGLSDAAASVLRLLSGRWTDRSGRRRPLVLTGYGISSVVRPLMALATAPVHVLAVRVVDRVGKGLRGTPRDVLIAESVPAAQRGTAFGWHRSMDHAGAMIGPLCAWLLLSTFALDLRTLFALAAIPGALAVGCVLVGVRDVPRIPTPVMERPVMPEAWNPRAALRHFLAPLAVFTLGRASDVFLIYLVGASDSPIETLPLIWVGCSFLRSAAAFPGGRLADRIGRRSVIVIGWSGHALACAALAGADSRSATLVWIGAYMLADGFSEGAQKALVSELAPRRRHGTAFGVYHLTIGILTLAASVLFGALYQWSGRATAFGVSAALAFAAAGWLLLDGRQAGFEARARPEDGGL
jgi:MFS family permease